MTDWYYARGGQQHGPVSFEQLQHLVRTGGIDPAVDSVWNSTMSGWKLAGEMRELFDAPAHPQPVASGGANPYAAPQSRWDDPSYASTIGLAEIVPGSQPIDAMECVRRGFDLTKRYYLNIFLIGLVYFICVSGPGFIWGIIDMMITVATSREQGGPVEPGAVRIVLSMFVQIILQVFSIFLQLGLVRVGLNLVSGREVSVGMLFGEGSKLLRAIGASLLFGIAFMIGILLLIFPGIYIAMRYGQFLTAIVDRDLGVIAAFEYSSTLTENSRVNLFVLALLSFLIVMAGMLACFIGLIFAGPVVWLAGIVAYRWMQYGSDAVRDQPGTETPMLAG
ncbi:DUF4339 domain-containing protein [Arenimonas oryziterrae]|uniref:GYF domain-containing protein n=1 Tax=Arenimonas oryziterrae DSM 21050 = YC6267 TaxID=1121015 RepID=A0A091APX8_9GAMM|nr:DUF4339 domain-containing protein [Arenimonas oryziterrae]KFN41034.1 hypothetical protein N789_03895 [Arenimonas oryziterrae DSM 21050 = YC6267]